MNPISTRLALLGRFAVDQNPARFREAIHAARDELFKQLEALNETFPAVSIWEYPTHGHDERALKLDIGGAAGFVQWNAKTAGVEILIDRVPSPVPIEFNPITKQFEETEVDTYRTHAPGQRVPRRSAIAATIAAFVKHATRAPRQTVDLPKPSP